MVSQRTRVVDVTNGDPETEYETGSDTDDEGWSQRALSSLQSSWNRASKWGGFLKQAVWVVTTSTITLMVPLVLAIELDHQTTQVNQQLQQVPGAGVQN